MHQKEVFDYVVKNRKVMPRTALRYAIELMPKELKAEAMKKDYRLNVIFSAFTFSSLGQSFCEMQSLACSQQLLKPSKG